MDLTYRKATLSDLSVLVDIRIEFMLAANHLPEDTDMSRQRRLTEAYYRQALTDGTHTAFLVFEGDAFVGTGAVSYYQVMPTYYNPTGRKAYIMNIYTRPAWRRRGIALHTLNLLVDEIRHQGVTFISLEATDMGRPVYETYGFRPMTDEMKLPEDVPTRKDLL